MMTSVLDMAAAPTGNFSKPHSPPNPAAAKFDPSPRRVYDVRPRQPIWGWAVVGYIWTKSIAAGGFLAAAAARFALGPENSTGLQIVLGFRGDVLSRRHGRAAGRRSETAEAVFVRALAATMAIVVGARSLHHHRVWRGAERYGWRRQSSAGARLQMRCFGPAWCSPR